MNFLDVALHVDRYLPEWINNFGTGIYALLFAIIFFETGVVFMAFLPGDSLLFVTGALAGSDYLNIFILIPTLIIAAILGDALNYWLGKNFGNQIANRWIKPEQLEATRLYFDRHGPRTIIIARFIPFIRTFAPFVAGLSKMNYLTFVRYNAIGAFVWVLSVTLIGYFLGKIPLIKDNFEIAIYGIIGISLIPAIIEVVSSHRQKITKISTNT